MPCDVLFTCPDTRPSHLSAGEEERKCIDKWNGSAVRCYSGRLEVLGRVCAPKYLVRFSTAYSRFLTDSLLFP